MKSPIRLALAALAFLAALAWSPKPAQAVPGTCEAMNFHFCSVDGRKASCTWSNGTPGTCVCDGGVQLWDCA